MLHGTATFVHLQYLSNNGMPCSTMFVARPCLQQCHAAGTMCAPTMCTELGLHHDGQSACIASYQTVLNACIMCSQIELLTSSPAPAKVHMHTFMIPAAPIAHMHSLLPPQV